MSGRCELCKKGYHYCIPNEIGWVEVCTTPKCTFSQFHHNRRVESKPVDNDRRSKQ